MNVSSSILDQQIADRKALILADIWRADKVEPDLICFPHNLPVILQMLQAFAALLIPKHRRLWQEFSVV